MPPRNLRWPRICAILLAIDDTDFWWHLKTGHWSLPVPDPFSQS